MRLIQLVSNAVLTASTRNFSVSSLIAPVALVAIGVVSLASAQDLSRQSAVEAAFLKENDAAMTKMMNDMAVKPRLVKKLVPGRPPTKNSLLGAL